MFPRPEQVEAGHERLHGVQHIAAARGLVTPNSLLCSEYCGYVASVPASAIGAYVFNVARCEVKPKRPIPAQMARAAGSPRSLAHCLSNTNTLSVFSPLARVSWRDDVSFLPSLETVRVVRPTTLSPFFRVNCTM